MNWKLYLTVLSLTCGVVFPASAADFKVGDRVTMSVAHICLTKADAEVVADASRKTGTGQDAWLQQVVNGACARVSLTGTITAIVDTYPEKLAAGGQEDIVEIAINGKSVFAFAPHGVVTAGLSL